MKKLLLFKNLRFKSMLLLGLLFMFSNYSWGQATIFDETFGTTASASYTGGTSTTPSNVDYTVTSNNGVVSTGVASGNGFLNFASAGTTATAVRPNLTYPFSSLSLGSFSTTLANNTLPVEWTVNMKANRVMSSSTSIDYGDGKYYLVVVLCSNSANLITSPTGTNGYALILQRKSGGTTNALRLVRFTNGLISGSGGVPVGTSATTLLAETPLLTPIAPNTTAPNNLSVKVVYTPAGDNSTGTWELFYREDSGATFVNPTTGTLTSAGTSTDNTYTSTAMTHFGFLGSVSTSNNSGNHLQIDNFKIKGGVAGSTPTITSTASSLSGFAYNPGAGPSNVRSIVISGTNLTGSIFAAVPTNYEISKDNFATAAATSALNLESGGTLSVRLKAGLITGTYSENISLSSSSATDVIIACSGSVTESEPTAQVTNLTFANNSSTGFTINWTDASSGGGTNHLVIIKAATDITSNPTDATTYTAANGAFTTGTALGGGFVVYNGIANTVAVTGLSKGTRYHVRVYDFNGSAGTENYLITSTASGYQTTTPGEITSAQSGPWATAATWTGNIVPTLGDNVIVSSNHEIDVSGATNPRCHNLTINSGGKLWSNGTKTIQIYGSSLSCAGTFGDSDATKELTTEFGNNLTISGSGGIYPFKIRPIAGISNIGIIFNSNTTVTNTTVCIQSDNTGNDNITYTVNSGKTLALGGSFSTTSSSSGLGNTNTIVNNNGTLNIGGSLNTIVALGKSYVVNNYGDMTINKLNINPLNSVQTPTINVISPGTMSVYGTVDSSNTSIFGAVTGSGTFTLNSTGTMQIASANGLEPIAGPIRTTNRIFSNGSSYSFLGNVEQVNGADLPSSITNLIINNSAGVVIDKAIDITGKLTISAGLLNAGNFLTLKSTSTTNASVAPVYGSITGNVTVERYIPAKRAWRALTSPVNTTNSIRANWQEAGTGNGINGFDIWSNVSGTGILTGGSGSSLLSYNSSDNSWSGVTDTTTSNSLLSGSVNKPFMAFVTGPFGSNNVTSGASATTIRATGALFTGNQTYVNTATQYTFIGNPYASPLDPALLLADTDNAAFGGNIWVWDANATGLNSVGTYNLFNNGTYANVTSNPAITTGTQIQSGQAFFVKSTTGGTFTIKETHKGTTFSNAVFRTAAPELFRVGLYKQENNEWSGRDGAMTVILSDAAANQAPNKMANSTENIAFTKNGASFASNHHLPLVPSDVFNVKVWNTTSGSNYKLKINTEVFTATHLAATLEDLYTNSRTSLNLDGSPVEYPFSVTNDALSTGNRFRIVFQNAVLGNNNPTTNGFSIVPNPVTGDSFQVNLGTLATGTYSYSICNAIGQEVANGSINSLTQNTNYEVKMSNAATGIYIMKIKGSDNSVYTAKIIKK
jgi:hypothetical protein